MQSRWKSRVWILWIVPIFGSIRLYIPSDQDSRDLALNFRTLEDHTIACKTLLVWHWLLALLLWLNATCWSHALWVYIYRVEIGFKKKKKQCLIRMRASSHVQDKQRSVDKNWMWERQKKLRIAVGGRRELPYKKHFLVQRAKGAIRLPFLESGVKGWLQAALSHQTFLLFSQLTRQIIMWKGLIFAILIIPDLVPCSLFLDEFARFGSSGRVADSPASARSFPNEFNCSSSSAFRKAVGLEVIEYFDWIKFWEVCMRVCVALL